MPFSSEARYLLLILAVSCPKIENNSNSDEYCQGGFSNGTVNTLRTSRICKDFQEKQAQNQARKINACRIHEVSAVCAYGLHRSAIRGAVPLVRGFA